MTGPFKIVARLIALILIFFGLYGLLFEMTTDPSFGGALLALAFIVPGCWWFYCESRDKQNPTMKVRRHWGKMFMFSLALALSGGALSPDTTMDSEADTKQAGISTPSSTSTTSKETSTTSSTTKTETVTSTTSTTTSLEPTEELRFGESSEDDDHHYTPAPEPTPEYTPAPTHTPAQVVQQPVAPQAPATYYQNCAAVRAAGAAPLYAGQPGYEAPRLDRDFDGIACE